MTVTHLCRAGRRMKLARKRLRITSHRRAAHFVKRWRSWWKNQQPPF